MWLGHDAEFEVVNEKGEGVPAHEFFPPKTEPFFTKYRTSPDAHADCIFRDGTSLEVNTPGFLSCIGYVLDSTMRSLRMAKARMPSAYDLRATSAYEVEADLRKAPPDVLDSGCGPVRNAYEGWEETAAFSEPLAKQRFAGGHIHLSGPEFPLLNDAEKRKPFCAHIARYLDLFLAVPILFIGLEGEAGVKRRKVYGKAGEYRFQTYRAPAGYKDGKHGIEYRVLGPEWLRDVGLAQITLRMARAVALRAASKYATLKLMEKMVLKSALMKEARAAINSGDTKGIFNSKAYQDKLQMVLKEGYRTSAGEVTIEHFRYLRENQERLFSRTTIHTGHYDGHGDTWPHCKGRWGMTV